jgi:hypothetical protein
MTDRDDTKSKEVSSGNVVSIREHTTKKGKVNQAAICRMLVDSVRNLPGTTLPKFPVHYEVLEPKLGATVPILVDPDETCQIASPQALANHILRYCDRELGYLPDFIIKPRLALETAQYFLGVHPAIPPNKIRSVRWADEPGYTYRRLPWKRQTGDAPTWERLLSRMSNNQAFIEWVGSLFFDEAYLHNYVWIYGQGGDGKGSINRFLARVFGNAYCSKTAPTMDRNGTVDKFWAYNLLGKRLAVFPDCESATFTTSGIFKSLTGGDPIDLEAKGGIAFTAHLNTRYMILANVKPAITSAKSDMRRIIYCEMEPTDEVDTDFEERLWEEGGRFLSQCVENYLTKYPKHGPINAQQDDLIAVIDENEQHLENFFNEYYAITSDEKAYTTAKDIKVQCEETWPRSRKTYREFLMWLKRVHKIEPTRHNLENGSKERRYYRMVPTKKTAHPGNCSFYEQ